MPRSGSAFPTPSLPYFFHCPLMARACALNIRLLESKSVDKKTKIAPLGLWSLIHTCPGLWGRQPPGEGSWLRLGKCFQGQFRRGPAGFHWFGNPCVSLSLADCCGGEETQPLCRESLRAACVCLCCALSLCRCGSGLLHHALRLCRLSARPAQS